MLHTENQVEDKILEFYIGLLGTAAEELHAIDPRIMATKRSLNRTKQLMLIQTVTQNEVQVAIKGVDVNKAPGCDGMNAYFYNKSCGRSGCNKDSD